MKAPHDLAQRWRRPFWSLLRLGLVASILLLVAIGGGEPHKALAWPPSQPLSTPAVDAAAQATGQEVYRLPGQSVAVYNLAGEIEVVSGTGSDVQVTVTRGGVAADRLEVAVDVIGGRTALRVVYPENRIVYGGGQSPGQTSFRVRSDGTFADGRASSGERVEIRSAGDGLDVRAKLRVEVPAGRSVEIYLGFGGVELRGVRGELEVDVQAGRVDASDVRGTLSVETGPGSVRVVDGEGSVSINTGSGPVVLSSLSGGEIRVDTGAGSVEGSSLSVSSLAIDTGSGRIRLDDIASPRISLDTGSGSVELALATDVDELDIDTGVGSVVLRLPSEFGAELSIDTGVGGISLEVPIQIRSGNRREVEGRLGDGQGRVRIDTSSGSVRVVGAL